MTLRESMVERLHERRLLGPLVLTRRHLCVHIPDVPAIRDRGVTRVRAPIDEDEAILAEQTVVALIIHEARNEELFLRMLAEIALDRDCIVELGETPAGMRTARPNDGGKGNAGTQIREREL